MALAGRGVFITGAARGIGAAMARAFAAQGARVGLADSNEALVRQTAAGIAGAEAFVTDVRNRASLQGAVDAFARGGGLDTMINNAVVFHYAPLVDMPEAQVGQLLDVGIKGALWGIQAATPHLIAHGGGCIINLSSVAVYYAVRQAAVYSAVKGAIDALTRQQAVELGPYGIRVNALAPGPVPTPATNARTGAEGWERRRLVAPLRRVVSDADIAAATLFLTGDEAASISGVTLLVDAGMVITGIG